MYVCLSMLTTRESWKKRKELASLSILFLAELVNIFLKSGTHYISVILLLQTLVHFLTGNNFFHVFLLEHVYYFSLFMMWLNTLCLLKIISFMSR